MARGRSYSKVHTPAMVRDYLSGESFPDRRPEREVWGKGPGQTPMVAVDQQRGDYIASIYRHVRWRILEIQPRYRWPRYHSMATLVRHLMTLKLVEKTGETETSDILVITGNPPEGASPDDLRLDPARGFQQRDYYRLTPGSQADLAWDNPMASIRAIYGIELVARPRAPRPTPLEEEAPARPAARPRRPGRPRRRAAPEEAPAPVSADLLEVHRQLELRREGLLIMARFAAQLGQTVVVFQDLLTGLNEFMERVRPYYSRFPLSTLLLDVGTLTGCTQAFATAETGGQRTRALGSCSSASAVVAVDLLTPLPVPDVEPSRAPTPSRSVSEMTEEELAEELGEEEPAQEEPAQEEPEEEEAGPTPEVIADLTSRWSTLMDRIAGWSRPNSTNAANLLDRFVQEVTDTHPEIREDDLNSAIDEVRTLLEAYQEIERSDYESSAEYQEARADGWQEFVDGLGNVDFSELGEV